MYGMRCGPLTLPLSRDGERGFLGWVMDEFRLVWEYGQEPVLGLLVWFKEGRMTRMSAGESVVEALRSHSDPPPTTVPGGTSLPS